MTTKIDVKGKNAHPIYLWAKENYGNSAIPKWNFHKILINKNGKIEDTFSSFTKPMSKKYWIKLRKYYSSIVKPSKAGFIFLGKFFLKNYSLNPNVD